MVKHLSGFLGLIPRLGRFPWRREWLPSPVFLPGEFHGQRSLVGYSPWGRKESDTTDTLQGQVVPGTWKGFSKYLLNE